MCPGRCSDMVMGREQNREFEDIARSAICIVLALAEGKEGRRGEGKKGRRSAFHSSICALFCHGVWVVYRMATLRTEVFL